MRCGMHSDMKEKRKRIVTKIGYVFCAEIDGAFKAYFQYVANDLTMLNSSVIRVFKKRYPMDYTPVIEEIVKDEVLFYAHTILKFGIADKIWYKVGKSSNIGEEDLKNVFFCMTQSINYNLNTHEITKVDPLKNWFIWRIGHELKGVGRLPKKYYNIVELGTVYPFSSIIERIKYGYYMDSEYEYSVLKRQPLSDVDSYLKTEDIDITVYYHFKGEHIVRELVIFNGEITRLTKECPSENGMTLRTAAFGDTNWLYNNFISREEFEAVWNA